MGSFNEQDIVKWSCNDVYTMKIDPTNTTNSSNDEYKGEGKDLDKGDYRGVFIKDANGKRGDYVVVDCTQNKYQPSMDAMTVANVKTGEMAIIIQGSNGSVDWNQVNFGNAKGKHNDQYDQAIQYYKDVVAKFSNQTIVYPNPITDENVTINLKTVTAVGGNSLGGGNAAAIGTAFPNVTAICVNAAPLDKGRIDGKGDYSNIIQVRTDADILHRLAGDAGRDDSKNYPGQIVKVNRSIFSFNFEDIVMSHLGAARDKDDNRPDLAHFMATDLVTGAILNQDTGNPVSGNSGTYIKLKPDEMRVMGTNLSRQADQLLQQFNSSFSSVENKLDNDESSSPRRIHELRDKLEHTICESIMSKVPYWAKLLVILPVKYIASKISDEHEELLNVTRLDDGVVKLYKEVNEWLGQNSKIMATNVGLVGKDISQTADCMDAVDRGQPMPSLVQNQLEPLIPMPREISNSITSKTILSYSYDRIGYTFEEHIRMLKFKLVRIVSIAESMIEKIPILGNKIVDSIDSLIGMPVADLVGNIIQELKPEILNLMFEESTMYSVISSYSQVSDCMHQQEITMLNCKGYLESSTSGQASLNLKEKANTVYDSLKSCENVVDTLGSGTADYNDSLKDSTPEFPQYVVSAGSGNFG